MKISRYFLSASLLLISFHVMITEVRSQNDCKKENVRGTHFITAFPENFGRNDTAQLHVMIVSFQNIIIEVRLNSLYRLSNNTYFAKTVYVQPMSYARVIVPLELEIIGTEKSYKTVEITADSEISVHVFHLEPFTTDGFLAIPTDNLGTQYVVASYHVHDGSLFTIYGTQIDTTVRIRLKSAITYENRQYADGDILTVKLSRYEALQLNSSGDLTGTIITSDNPVGVISGHACTRTPGTYCDALLEQSIPVNNWGTTHFYSATGGQAFRSIYLMIAYYDDTVITFPSGNQRTLDSGESIRFSLLGNGIIVTSKPASLVQIFTGYYLHKYEYKVDPSMIQVPTEKQFALKLGFTTPTHSGNDSRGFYNYVNIIVKSNERHSLRLNGNQITNRNTSIIPYIEYEGYITSYNIIVVRLPREEDVYFITQAISDYSPMSAIAYGFEAFESYGYAAGLSLPCTLQTTTLPPTTLPPTTLPPTTLPPTTLPPTTLPQTTLPQTTLPPISTSTSNTDPVRSDSVPFSANFPLVGAIAVGVILGILGCASSLLFVLCFYIVKRRGSRVQDENEEIGLDVHNVQTGEVAKVKDKVILLP